jgi:hypothetical protein
MKHRKRKKFRIQSKDKNYRNYKKCQSQYMSIQEDGENLVLTNTYDFNLVTQILAVAYCYSVEYAPISREIIVYKRPDFVQICP